MVNRSDDIRHILSQVSNVILENDNAHSFTTDLEIGEAYFSDVKISYSEGTGIDLTGFAGVHATQPNEFATIEDLTAHLPNEDIDVMNDERLSDNEKERIENEANADIDYKVDSVYDDEPDTWNREEDWDQNSEPRHNFESINEMVRLLDVAGILTEDLDPTKIAKAIITQMSNEDGTMGYEKDLARKYIAKVITKLKKIPDSLKTQINRIAQDLLFDVYAKEGGFSESVEFFKEIDNAISK